MAEIDEFKSTFQNRLSLCSCAMAHAQASVMLCALELGLPVSPRLLHYSLHRERAHTGGAHADSCVGFAAMAFHALPQPGTGPSFF